MPDPSRRNLLSDGQLVQYAKRLATKNDRILRKIKEDAVRDSLVYEDRESGERRTLPNKFILAIGHKATFELVDPEIEIDNNNI